MFTVVDLAYTTQTSLKSLLIDFLKPTAVGKPVAICFKLKKNIFMFPSVQIDLPPTMVITKGLPGKYTAVQMHLHWGGWDLEASGAEHTIDGIRYMAEVGLKKD